MRKLYASLVLSLIFVIQGMAQITCNAGFNFTPDPSSSLMYNFQHQSTSTGAAVGSGYFYRTKFYFGDGSSRWDSVYVGWQGGFSHYYNSPGIYALMLEQEVVDSANGNVLCTSYAYDTIMIASGVSCSAHYSVTLPSPGSLTATFQNNSLNSQSSLFTRFYSWDFGDGNSSTSFSPTHAYSSMGSYQVVLNTYALDTNGVDTLCSSSFSNSVQAGAVDTCDAHFSSSVDPSTREVSFKGYSSVYTVTGNRTISDYLWDFGDGNTGTGRFINHTYAQMNTYSVQLTTQVRDSITQALICSDVSTRSVYVGYPSPKCRAKYAIDSINASPTNFNIFNLSTPVSNHPVYSVSYHWDFGDSTSSNQAFPVHTFAGNGPYTVCLTITASDSLNRTCSDTYCRQLGIDSSGNVIYKSSGGFTLNVLDPNATVGGKEHELLDVQIYPNPASTSVNVEGMKEGGEWSLYNIQGASVAEGYLEPGESKIDFGTKKPGLYILNLQSRGYTKSMKLSIK